MLLRTKESTAAPPFVITFIICYFDYVFFRGALLSITGVGPLLLITGGSTFFGMSSLLLDAFNGVVFRSFTGDGDFISFDLETFDIF